MESLGGSGVSEPISASEMASEARSVVGRLRKYLKRGESRVTAQAATEWVGEGSRRRWLGSASEPEE